MLPCLIISFSDRGSALDKEKSCRLKGISEVSLKYFCAKFKAVLIAAAGNSEVLAPRTLIFRTFVLATVCENPCSCQENDWQYWYMRYCLVPSIICNVELALANPSPPAICIILIKNSASKSIPERGKYSIALVHRSIFFIISLIFSVYNRWKIKVFSGSWENHIESLVFGLWRSHLLMPFCQVLVYLCRRSCRENISYNQVRISKSGKLGAMEQSSGLEEVLIRLRFMNWHGLWALQLPIFQRKDFGMDSENHGLYS